MTYSNLYNTSELVRKAFNSVNTGSRNGRKYCITMLPGKKKNISIPVKYFIRIFSVPSKLKKSEKEILNEKLIKVNGYYAKDPKFPIAMGDLIEIEGNRYFFEVSKDGRKEFKLKQIKDNLVLYPIASYIRRTSHYLVNTNNGLNFRVSLEDIETLKKFGPYLIVNLQSQQTKVGCLEDNYRHYELVKLTGKDSLRKSEIVSLHPCDSNNYDLTLKYLNSGVEKKTYLSKGALLNRYFYFVRQGMSIV